MTKRLKYPEEFIPIINFETGDTDMIRETVEQRRARLRRSSAARRQAAFANQYALRNVRADAVAEAWRLYYAGASFPIHFDVIHSSGKYTTTERLTLVDAGFTKHFTRPDEIVGSMGAQDLRGRAATVPAHFIWPPQDG
jgi:hypothetical protein